jgi:two-component system response regulator FixJ
MVIVAASCKKRIYFVDDDPDICKSVKAVLVGENYDLKIFTDPHKCLDAIDTNYCNLLISDIKMPEMSGFSLLMKTKKKRPMLPVILLTGYGDIPMAIRAIKAGAEEFIEKPINRDALIATVKKVLTNFEGQQIARVQELSKTEREILKLIVQGMSNKEIAYKIYRARRTIEDHRNHIMQKLKVHNVVDLVKVAMKMPSDDLPEEVRTGFQERLTK